MNKYAFGGLAFVFLLLVSLSIATSISMERLRERSACIQAQRLGENRVCSEESQLERTMLWFSGYYLRHE